MKKVKDFDYLDLKNDVLLLADVFLKILETIA